MKDPYKKHESRRYKAPIASREAILAYLQANKSGVTFAALAKGSDKNAVQARLKAMVRDGQITLVKNKYKALPSKILSGFVLIRTDGYAIVRSDLVDYLLPPRQAWGLVRGDYVKFRTTQGLIKGKSIAILIAVLKRHVGTLFGEINGDYVQLFPGQIGGNGRLKLAKKSGKNGQTVKVLVTEYPEQTYQGKAKVVAQLDVEDMRVWAALLHGLPYEFSDSVLQAAAKLKVQGMSGRKDLTKLPFVTIDGASAQDFDDAVYVQATPKGFLLYVAIADVSAYVTAGSELDQEAELRGTSVYFPGQVIPMLPERISNDLCSLLPKVERAVLVAEMAINAQGKRERTKLYKAMIKSHARFTYQEVASFIAKQAKAPDFWQASMLNLQALCASLSAKKIARGALEIERSEQVIILDATGKVERVCKSESTLAHKWIELCMLEANEAVAEFLISKDLPGIYREHGLPKPDKLADLVQTFKHHGIEIKFSKQSMSLNIRQCLAAIKEHNLPEALLLLVLRTLPQASYTEQQLGHFGLAYKHYAHFTSPIRRYPDLFVHRQISAYLEQSKAKTGNIQQLAQHFSFTERRADQAARDVCKQYICQFLESRIGLEFTGKVASVLDFGMFVELDVYGAEGLVHISALANDRFEYYSDAKALVGQYTGKTYTLGDIVRVKLLRVDLTSKQIDFALID